MRGGGGRGAAILGLKQYFGPKEARICERLPEPHSPLTALREMAMLRVMRNTRSFDNTILERALDSLRERLPAQWIVTRAAEEPRGTDYLPDALLKVRAPDGTTATVVVEVKQAVTPAVAAALASQLNLAQSQSNAAASLLVARYLSPLARQRLRERGVSYFDLTGNARIALDRPAIFIEARGADRDPAPLRRDSRSLKGGSAARIVRALCDWKPPVGVRALARRAGTDPGYVTRILTLLESEDVLSRDRKGAVATVKWKDLLRRWAQDYTVTRTNRATAFLEPRSVDALLSRFSAYRGNWALTGSRAVPRAASTAITRTVSCYVDDPERAVADLKLREGQAGANVLLLEPFDSVVWERTRKEGNLIRVAVSQCAVDLLTGTGREPSEAEALLVWMERNESVWRA